jgi:hypothetical protein
MIIKPMDVLYMLDDEDLAMIGPMDLKNLCTAISLDLQLKNEEDERECTGYRRSLH